MGEKTKQPNKQESPPKANKFWNFVAEAEESPAELILYGEIASSESWWRDTVTPKKFSDELRALGEVSEIVVRINSGGGDVFAANAIYTRLKDHKAKITVKIDGWAASAATIIAMAGDTIQIPANGVFMIHDPKMGVIGYYGAEEFVKLSEELAVIKKSIINGYALKTGKDEAEISALMSNETWYDGEQAVENGFCNEIMFGEVNTEVENASHIVVNSVSIDLERYPAIPKMLLNSRASGCLPYKNEVTNKTEKGVNEMEIKTVDGLKLAYPELVAKIAENAAETERKRIQAVESVSLPGFEEIVDKAKFETPATAETVAMLIIAEQKKQGNTYLNNLNEDVSESGADKITASRQESPADGVNPFMAAINEIFPETK